MFQLGWRLVRMVYIGRMPTRLLAVVAKALSRGANLGVVANIATLVAGTAR